MPQMPAKAPRYTSTLIRNAPFADVEQWTPKLVGEQLVEALIWVRRYGGPVGPASIRSCMPIFKVSLEDHLAEGWGLPEVADDDDLPPVRVMASPAEVTRHIAVLEWPATYLGLERQGSGRMLGLWAACKARRCSFSKAIDGRISRAHVFRLRDRALSLISIGLDRDGVPVRLP